MTKPRTLRPGEALSPLRAALMAANVPPVGENRQVYGYMVTEAAKYPGNWLWRLSERCGGIKRLREIHVTIAAAGFFPLFLLAAGTGAFGLEAWATGLATAMAVWVFGLLGLGYQIKIKSPAGWRSFDLFEYKGTIPPFVETMTSTIKMIEPRVGFRVAELFRDEQSLDPVLFAYLPSLERGGGIEEIAVAIWDKKGRWVELLPAA